MTSSKSVLSIHLKVSIQTGTTMFLFLDLVQLDKNAECFTDNLLQCLKQHGFTDEYLQQNFIAVVLDGGSVMLGRHSGIATRLCTLFPDLVIWHCMNHRLKLAVNDALDEVNGVNHFKNFMKALYKVYRQSPKQARTSCYLQRIKHSMFTNWQNAWHPMGGKQSTYSTSSMEKFSSSFSTLPSCINLQQSQWQRKQTMQAY